MPLDRQQIKEALMNLEVWHLDTDRGHTKPKPNFTELQRQLFTPENLSTPEGIGFAAKFNRLEPSEKQNAAVKFAVWELAEKDPRYPTDEAIAQKQQRVKELAKSGQGKALTTAVGELANLEGAREQIASEVARSAGNGVNTGTGLNEAAWKAQNVVNEALNGKSFPEGYVAPEPSSIKALPAKAAAAPAMAGSYEGRGAPRTLYASIDPEDPRTVMPGNPQASASVPAASPVPVPEPARQQVVIVSGGNGVGKSTYVDNAMARGDIPKDAVVVDIDRIVKQNWPDEPSFATLNGAQKRHAQAEYWRIYDEAMASGKHVVVLDAQLTDQHVRDFNIPEKGAANRPEVHTIAMVGDKEKIWERTVARGQEGGAEAGKVVDRTTFDTAHNATTGVLDTCASVSDKTTILDMTDPAKPVTVATIDAKGQVTQHDGVRAKANGIDFAARGYSVSDAAPAPAHTPAAVPHTPEGHISTATVSAQPHAPQPHAPQPHAPTVPFRSPMAPDVNKGGAMANMLSGFTGASTSAMEGDWRGVAVESIQAGLGYASDVLADKGNTKGATVSNLVAGGVSAINQSVKTYQQTGNLGEAVKAGGTDAATTAGFAGGVALAKKGAEVAGGRIATATLGQTAAAGGSSFGGALVSSAMVAFGYVVALKKAVEVGVDKVAKAQDPLDAMVAEVSTPLKGKPAMVIYDSNGQPVTMDGAQKRLVSDKTYGEGYGADGKQIPGSAGAPALSNYSYKDLGQVVIGGPNAMSLSEEPHLAKLGVRNFQDPYYIKQQLIAHLKTTETMPDKDPNASIGSWIFGADGNVEKSIAVRTGHSAFRQFQNYELQFNAWVEEKTGAKMPHYHPDNENANDRSQAKQEMNTMLAQQKAQELAKASGVAMLHSGMKHDASVPPSLPEGRAYVAAAQPQPQPGSRLP